MENNDSSDEEDEENLQEFGKGDWRNQDSEDEQDALENSDSSDDEDYQNDSEFDKSALNDDDSNEDDDESDNDEAEILANSLSWKDNLAQKARDAFLQRHSESKNLMRLVYGCYSQSEKVKI